LKASSLLQLAERDGLRLALENGDKIKAYGPAEAIRKWGPAIRSQKPSLVAELSKAAKKFGWEKLADLPPDEPVGCRHGGIQPDVRQASRERQPDRLDWWNAPVEGWREGRLTIRNIPTGKVTTINLRAAKPQGRA
jgi:hypothetical protein